MACEYHPTELTIAPLNTQPLDFQLARAIKLKKAIGLTRTDLRDVHLQIYSSQTFCDRRSCANREHLRKESGWSYAIREEGALNWVACPGR